MSDTLTLVNGSSIYEMYNLKSKVYPSGLEKLKKYSFDTIKGRKCLNQHNGNSTDEQLDKYLKKRVKQRKEKIIDFAYCNDWQYFVTLTFDTKNKENFPRGYSHEQAIFLLKKWINNQHNKNKNMRYILVSEFHKESGNLHFHGLFSKVNWDLSIAFNSKTGKPLIENGVQVYNLNDYKYGFTTISEIKDSKKVSIYLSKYITKDLISLKFKKVFWHSQNLKKPIENFNYINSSLKEFIDHDNEVSYYNSFKKKCCKIEIAELIRKENIYELY